MVLAHSPPSRRLPLLLLAAVLLVALNLRGPIVAVASVVDDLRRHLGASARTISLLTGLPVLCFSLAAPLASWVIARRGSHQAIIVCLVGVLAGTVLRSAGGVRAALAGTLVIGVAITIGNIAVPVIVGRDFPTAVNVVTGGYTAALNVGSMLAAALTSPMAASVGWRGALASWAALILLAGVVWVTATRRFAPPPRAAGPPAGHPAADRRATLADVRRPTPMWRRPAAWGLTLAFGAQAFSYYGVTAWLPSLLADERHLSPARAGITSSVFQITAMIGAFAVPALVAWWRRPSLVLLAVCAAWACLPLGLVAAPGAWPLWCVLGGAAQGGGITIIFIAIVRRSSSEAGSRRLSALVQGVGYAIAASGPTVVGAAHDATGGWRRPMQVILTAVLVMAVAGAPSAGGRASAHLD